MARAPYLVERLAQYAVGHQGFAPAVLNEGKRIILDQLACQIACATLPWSLGYREAALSFGTGDGATVVYHGDRLPLDQAAFVNSCFGHGAEFDDTHLRSSTHAGAVVVPVVLALCEKHGIGGRTALEATIVGLEILIRIATASAPHLHDRGHHVPPAVGPFGAAASACRLLGLAPEITAHALSIAGSHAAGLLEFTQTGGTVKRAHCAIPAQAGLHATAFARFGNTGPLSVMEGKRGFFASFAGEYDLSLVTEGLGEDYIFTEMGYKPITSAFPAHAPLEALGGLHREHGFAADDVEQIRIGMSHHSLSHVGMIREPKDVTDAHYSVAHGAAVCLLTGGNGFYNYRDEDTRDPRFRALARRVDVYVDPQCEEERLRLNNRAAIVTVHLKDGRQLERRVTYSKGHPRNPLSDSELEAKFLDCVTPRLGAERARELAQRVWNIDADGSDIGQLIARTIKPD